MAVWAISIVGIVILTVLSDVILPDGETNKYIKTVVGIVAVLVLVSPLPSIINGEIDVAFGDNSQNNEQNIQHEYLQFVCKSKEKYTDERAEQYLSDNGYGQCEVNSSYVCDYDSGEISLQYIDVHADKSVINGEDDNINITEDIRKVITKLFGIDAELVRVYV